MKKIITLFKRDRDGLHVMGGQLYKRYELKIHKDGICPICDVPLVDPEFDEDESEVVRTCEECEEAVHEGCGRWSGSSFFCSGCAEDHG